MSFGWRPVVKSVGTVCVAFTVAGAVLGALVKTAVESGEREQGDTSEPGIP